MSSSPSTPATPDYTGAATATAQGNLEATRAATAANRVNTYTPYGNLTYSQDPNNPDSWTSNVSLSNSGQALLDQQNKTSAGLGNLQDAATARVGNSLNSTMPTAYNASGVTQPGAYDPTQATNNATALINSRLAPQQARDSAALDAQLANQGLTPGSEAYNNAKTLQSQSQNDASNAAALSGITLGQQQQAQTYSQQNTNNLNAQNQQNQQYTQETANRNAPINELSAIRSGSQVTNPTFSSAPAQSTTSGADTLGATTQAGNYAQGLYGSQTASANSANSALASTAAAGLGAYASYAGLAALF